MFDHINFAGLAKSKNFGYAAALPFFKGRKKLAFEPGINVLFGPNGSGKSTIIKMLGQSMCALQGGVSTVTETALRDVVDLFDSKGKDDKIGVKIAHDGQPVFFFDPRVAVGLFGGGAAFDDDFFSAGVRDIQAAKTSSHGQMSAVRGDRLLGILTGDAPFPEKIDRRIHANSSNDVWKAGLDKMEARLLASIDKAQPTILLDEPETNFSLLWQARLWSLITRPAVMAKFQIIVASHSALSLGIEHANYIDLVPGFREEVETILRHRFGTPA